MKISQLHSFNLIFITAILLFRVDGCGKGPNSNSSKNIPDTGNVSLTQANARQPGTSIVAPPQVEMPPTVTEPIFGVTITSLPEVNTPQFAKLISALDTFRNKRSLVIRINIDPNKADDKLETLSYDDYVNLIDDDLAFYADWARRLKEYGAVMVNIADSHDLYHYRSAAAYGIKMRAYLEHLGPYVSIWEIGNEVNGDWAGWRTKDDKIVEDNGDKKKWRDEDAERDNKIRLINDQVSNALEKVETYKRAHRNFTIKTALTLYFFGMDTSRGCRDKARYEMPLWAGNLGNDVKTGLDYVFVSYYEDDNNDDTNCPFMPAEPAEQLRVLGDAFTNLATIFTSPDTKFGFGEFAPQCKECGSCDSKCHSLPLCDICVAKINEYIPRYYVTYGKKLPQEKFVRGFFYWYFYEDTVKQKNCFDRNNTVVTGRCPTLRSLLESADSYDMPN